MEMTRIWIPFCSIVEFLAPAQISKQIGIWEAEQKEADKNLLCESATVLYSLIHLAIIFVLHQVS